MHHISVTASLLRWTFSLSFDLWRIDIYHFWLDVAINSTVQESNQKGQQHEVRNENALEKAWKRLEESVMREILNTVQEKPQA